jgi:parallel beta-helix repeat protein
LGGPALRRKIPSIAICIVLILSSFVMLNFYFGIIDVARGEVLYVNETGSNGAYVKIQDAIDNASDGDTVYVYSGTYYENVVVNKTINLTGEDRDSTIIDGDYIDGVRITSDWVNISGFKLIHAASFWSGIRLDNVRKCKVYNNFAYGNDRAGIYLNNSSENLILDNIATASNYYGIYLRYSDGNNIIGNNVSSNSIGGLRLDFSNENNIYDNMVSFSLHTSILLLSSNENDLIGNFVSNGDQNHIIIDSSNDNNISYNTVTSANAVGIGLKSSNGNHIAYNNATNNGRGFQLDNSFGNDLIGNNASSNSWDGIRIDSSDGNSIIDNIASHNIYYGIYLISSGWNNIHNTTMIGDGIFIRGYTLNHWNTHNIDTSNTVNGKPVIYWKNQTGGIVPSEAGEVILANCTNTKLINLNLTNGSVGVELGFSSNNEINGINLSSNYRGGIYLYSSSENTITGITVMNNYYGINLVGGSNNNNITNNNISNSHSGGISLDYSYSNMVKYNSVSSNIRTGISLSDSRDNTVISNSVLFNRDDGIRLWDSNENNILGNIATKNENGIYLYSSVGNNISGNNFSLNDEYGVQLTFGSSSNLIYHNNILDNVAQAYDSTNNNNQWDNGYPSGGNYWSDYGGVDLNSTPNQNVPPSDGIGDTPYVIDANSQDNYPLMEPYTSRTFENYTILKEGWNLISIPLIQDNQNLQKVLEMIDGYYDAVQWYKPNDLDDPWKHHKVSKPFGNDLFELNETMGIWIHITHPGETIFLYNGTQPSENQSITLHKGWNMVGYPSNTNHNRTIGLNNLEFGIDVDAIQYYNSATKTWYFMGPEDNFDIGRGYWIHSKVETLWQVPL